ncbi:MAG: glycosyltransferase [Candidatus Aminicenantes bacterium]|nr:glycosyltransferase [Candidatus Aminicenantes bacterium]
MNILLVAYYFPPLVSGGSQRPARMHRHLARLGNQVTVLAPSYTQTDLAGPDLIRVYDPSHNLDRRGLHRLQWFCRRLPVEISNRFGRYSSIYLRWQQEVLRRADAILATARPELILATYPPVESLEIGLRLAQLARVPLVADFRDGLLFEPVEAKRLDRFACLRRRYERIEAEVVAKAAALITVSPYLSAYFESRYGPGNVSTIPNGYDEDDRRDFPAGTEFAGKGLHVVHAGRIALSDATRSLRPFAEAVERLRGADPGLAEKLHLHFIGRLSTGEKRDLARLRRSGLASLHGEKGHAASLAMQRQADLLLLITSAARPGIAPGKLFEYLAVQKPILALDDGTYAGEIVRECGGGWVVPARDARAIGAILEEIIRDRSTLAARIPSAASVQAYSATRQMQQLNALLCHVLARATGGHEA